MSKEKKPSEISQEVKIKKSNFSGKKRSTADLKGTIKGSVIRTIRAAASISNLKENDRAGLDLGEKSSAKNLAGRLNAVVKQKGKIDMMSESSEEFVKIVDLSKAALDSLKKSKYDSSVKSLLNYILNSLSSGGVRGFNASALSDISF